MISRELNIVYEREKFILERIETLWKAVSILARMVDVIAEKMDLYEPRPAKRKLRIVK
jgi:hypothetical protein